MRVERRGFAKLLLAALCGVVAAFVLSVAVADASPVGVGTARSGVRFRRVVVERTLSLPAGVAKRSFTFTIHADYPDEVILVVSRSAAVSVRALSADGMEGIGGTTRPWTTGCEHHGPRDVCTQGEEWCGLVQGLWRVAVRKTSEPAAVARVRLVFVRDVIAM